VAGGGTPLPAGADSGGTDDLAAASGDTLANSELRGQRIDPTGQNAIISVNG
jgi:hypothetical protein